MLLPDGPRTPLTTLLVDKDVETMTSVSDYMTEVFLYVTSGPEHVAKYHFQRRYPFTIGEKNFLQEGVTEEQHQEDIKELVGGHPIVCSKHMLEIMFNEPQLLIVFRVALEIELLYANIGEDGAELPRLTVDDVIDMGQGVTISPEDPYNFDPCEDEVLYGEPMTLDELQRGFPNTQEPSNIHLPTNGRHQSNGDPPRVLPTFEDMNEEEAYWNGLLNEDVSYEVYGNPPQPPPHGATNVQIGPNRRISAAPPPLVILIQDDDDTSHTGSSDGINDNENIITLTQAVPMPMVSTGQSNNDAPIGNGRTSNVVDTEANPVTPQLPVIGTTNGTATVTEPSLELTLGTGNGQTINPGETLIDISDSSSEAEDVTGGLGPLF
ncbi:unnamed protein product [Brassica oleracea]